MEDDFDDGELRARAKHRLEGKACTELSEKDHQKLAEELRIHKEELILQNQELKLAEVKLVCARAKYLDLFNKAPVGYIMLSRELIIEDANPKAAILLGYEVQESLIHKGISRLIPCDSHESLFKHYTKLASGLESESITIPVRRTDGTKGHIQLVSNLIENEPSGGFRTALTDVTELMRSEGRSI
jgi:PAS domain S-box-containing protein